MFVKIGVFWLESAIVNFWAFSICCRWVFVMVIKTSGSNFSFLAVFLPGQKLILPVLIESSQCYVLCKILDVVLQKSASSQTDF